MADFVKIVSEFTSKYSSETASSIKIIDVYLVYILLTGIIQFVYCALVGTFPFNSFLSGFISTVGSFILAGMYRYCLDPFVIMQTKLLFCYHGYSQNFLHIF